MFLTVHIISFAWNIFWVVVSDTIGLLWVTGKRLLAPNNFLRMTHRFVFLGLSISVISGAYLFWSVSDYLLTVSAFYTKMLLVLALVINGFAIGKHISVAESTSFAELGNEKKNIP